LTNLDGKEVKPPEDIHLAQAVVRKFRDREDALILGEITKRILNHQHELGPSLIEITFRLLGNRKSANR
jgi:hypothetical protein